MTLLFDDAKKLEKTLGPEAAEVIAKLFEARDEAIQKEAASKHDIALIQKDIALLRADVETRLAETRTEIIKWVAGMLVAQAALIAALVKLL
ncbi:MAG: hypothetical protein RDU30_12245 [Desulfovibrionaceae bacterium]|nr:hypothetical protein [Desulfovibrionaceae bacterium]